MSVDNNKKIVQGEMIPVYLDLEGESFGFYRIRPGKKPYICLATELLDMARGIHLTVYQTLLNYHRAIPADSCYRLFEMTRYFEELISQVAEAIVEQEVIIFARAPRRWGYAAYYPDDYRMIG